MRLQLKNVPSLKASFHESLDHSMVNFERTLNISTLLLTFWKILKTEIFWYWSLGAVQWNCVWESLIHLYLSPWTKVYKAATFISLVLEMTILWEGENTLQISQSHVVSFQSPWTESQWCPPAGRATRETEWVLALLWKSPFFFCTPIANLETYKTHHLTSRLLGRTDINMQRELMHIFIF